MGREGGRGLLLPVPGRKTTGEQKALAPLWLLAFNAALHTLGGKEGGILI